MTIWICYAVVAALLAIIMTFADDKWSARIVSYAICVIWPLALVGFAAFVVIDELDQRRWRAKHMRLGRHS